MRVLRKRSKIKMGLFIPTELLARVHIEDKEIELELTDGEIRIHPTNKKTEPEIFSFSSPLWKCVGFATAENVSASNHDRYIYDEEV